MKLVAGAAAVWLAAVAMAGPAAAERPRGTVVRIEHQRFDDAPEIGPRDALVTVELFFVPGSPTSHNAFRVVTELQRAHPTRVRVVFRPREGPPVAVPSIAMFAHAQGKFLALMAELTRGDSTPSLEQTIEIAVRLGLDRGQVTRAHLDDATIAGLKANQRRYFRMGVTSPPALALNGRVLHDRTITLGELENEYRAALELARHAVGQGVPRRALPIAGARRLACGDDEEDEDDDSPGAPAERELPLFGWHLATLAGRGTGCPPAPHIAGRLDDSSNSRLPDVGGPYLLHAPLPSAGMPSLGPSDAPVPLYVVCNLRAGPCIEQLEHGKKLAEYFSGLVRVVYVPWVDPTHEEAPRALAMAEVALCAAAAGRGSEFIRGASSLSLPTIKKLDLAALAQVVGLDAEALSACAGRGAPRARAAIAAARAAGIGWGPTVVIGGRAYVGGFSGDERPAADLIEAELAPGLLETLVPSY